MDCPLPAAWAGIRGQALSHVEDLGLSPNAPCHVFITSKRRDLASVLRTQAIAPPLGNFPLLQMVTEGGVQGGGDPLYIS